MICILLALLIAHSPGEDQPLYTKLFLDKALQKPFRLIFKAYNGTRNDPPGKMSFQVDTIDLRQPSDFLKIGDVVPNTRLKLDGFNYKGVSDRTIDDQIDISELTLVNVDTGAKTVLVFNVISNFPTFYARFVYKQPQPPQLIVVKSGQEFALRPEIDERHRYRLIDVNDAEARIQLPSGEIHVVKPDPDKAEGK